MDTLLAVAGIVVTILLGIWGIVIAKQHYRAVKVTFALDQVIALTDDITQNFPDLKISFREKPVSQSLVLLKGYMVNTGKRDISPDMVADWINANIPLGFEWIECKIVNRSPALIVNAELVSQIRVVFPMGLWKVQEFFKFEALAQVPFVKANPEHQSPHSSVARLINALTFSHRIVDLKGITETRIPDYGTWENQRVLSIIKQLLFVRNNVLIGVITMFLFGMGMLIVSNSYPNKVVGYIADMDGQERQIAVEVKGDMLHVTDQHGYSKQLTSSEFDQIAKKKIAILRKTNTDLKGGALIYIIFAIILLAVFILQNSKEKRLLSKIANNG